MIRLGARKQKSGGGRVGPAFGRLRVSANNGTFIDILHENRAWRRMVCGARWAN